MGYTLDSGVHFCMAGEYIVVLKESSDRYFLLSKRAAAALRPLAEGRSVTEGELQLLMKAGVIVPSQYSNSTISTVSNISPARSALEQDSGHRVALNQTLQIVITLLIARLSVRSRSFTNNLQRLARKKAAAPCSRQADVADLSAAFERVRQKMPFKAACLPDTLALCHFLFRQGHRPNLVIGVQLNPFRAHCWAQTGDLALNEAVDHARVHTPIRIV